MAEENLQESVARWDLKFHLPVSQFWSKLILYSKAPDRSKGIGDDDTGDEDYEAEYDDDSDEEDGEGRKRKRVRGPQNKVIIPKNRPNFYGAVPGVEIGRIWETRMECSRDGIMRPPVAGIHGGIIIKSF